MKRRVHEFVTGTNCDHNEVNRKADSSEPWQCQQCGRVFLDGEDWFPKPYTTDLNAVREAEAFELLGKTMTSMVVDLITENKRLREALIKIRSPHVSDPTPENIAREALK